MMKEVAETHEIQQDKYKKYANKARMLAIVFQESDRVMVKTRMLSHASQGITSKFTPRRDGPYKIAEHISPTSYRLTNDTRELLSIHHVSDLVPWKRAEVTDVSCKTVRVIRQRGRPKKNNAPPLSKRIRSSSGALIRSKGGE
ncbi:hypothetical protein P5V15_002774 [Pogonomyrmex californicus]